MINFVNAGLVYLESFVSIFFSCRPMTISTLPVIKMVRVAIVTKLMYNG
jgi:hypothetical protein